MSRETVFDFWTCVEYLISEDMEIDAISNLTESLKRKTDKIHHKLDEQRAIINIIRKINNKVIKNQDIANLLSNDTINGR